MAEGYNQGEFFQGNYPGYDNGQGNAEAAGYDMGPGGGEEDQFPPEQQFQQFDYNQGGGYAGQQAGGYAEVPAAGGYMEPQAAGGYVDTSYPRADMQSPYVATGSQPAYTPSIFTPEPAVPYTAGAEGPESFEDEPPLLEELGINFDHIRHKTLAVLNPLKSADNAVMRDTDLAGPLVFCFAFGGSMLLAGKVQFGYIYGIGVVGCLAMYALLNLMSLMSVSVTCIISVLGYCLLPMVLLSFTAAIFSLQGLVGTVLTSVAVLWCSVSASKLFVLALEMDHQQLLVAYPCALVYAVFALLTVF